MTRKLLFVLSLAILFLVRSRVWVLHADRLGEEISAEMEVTADGDTRNVVSIQETDKEETVMDSDIVQEILDCGIRTYHSLISRCLFPQ